MYRYLCQFVTKLEFSQQILEKIYIKFHENPSIGSRVVPFEQTDRQTETTKLILPFRNLANGPKSRYTKVMTIIIDYCW